MQESTLLILDCNPADGLGKSLRSLLESQLGASAILQYQALDIFELDGYDANIADVIVAVNPSLIFLVLTPPPLERSAPWFNALRRVPAPVLVVTEKGNPNDIFALLELGAADYITPPLNASNLLPRVWRLLDKTQRSEGQSSMPYSTPFMCSLIGVSKTFVDEISKIPLIAQSEASVFITGETGTGKELCARAIHQLSARERGPFVPVNCGAIPVELAENELFGHERGAYTGASTTQPGLVQTAQGGTLFLDEINSLPMLAQAKLLRFLQEKEYRHLGSTTMLQADVRIIAAANVEIEEAVQAGLLRRDLYYRLNVMPLKPPPLRHRREDIPLLARHFLAKYNNESSGTAKSFSIDAMQTLLLYEWPGNVRELEHVIQRTVMLCEQPIIRSADIAHTIAAVSPGSFRQAKAIIVDGFERAYLREVLSSSRGNISKAAQFAKMDRHDLRRLIKKHGIDPRHFKRDSVESIIGGGTFPHI
jgi:two-component system, NtrC family, response regulator GlrR